MAAVAVTVVAGLRGGAGFADGEGASARFREPMDVAVDGANNAIVADAGNHCVRRIAPDGTVTTLAGAGGTAGFADGPGAAARFRSPTGVAVDGNGNVIVADTGNDRIRRIAADGSVSTLAGAGAAGFADGPGLSARFSGPMGVAVDGEGHVVVADSGNDSVRRIAPDGSVSTLAGVSARFSDPVGVAVDGEGYVVVADAGSRRIRMIAPDGAVTTLADAPGIRARFTARFGQPAGVAVDVEGNIIVTDCGNGRICKIAPDGTDTTLVEAGGPSMRGVLAGVAIDREGHVLVAVRDLAVIQRVGHLAPQVGKRKRAAPAHFEDFASMLEDTDSMDVSFKVGGETIKAHKGILVARSSYFRATFAGSSKEAAQEEVEIKETTPDAFRALLKYLYTDDLSFADESILDVMCKAKEMDLKRVCDHCLSHTRRNIGAKNAVLWLAQADDRGLAELRSSALDFVRRNFKRARAESRGSLDCLQERPALMLDILKGIEM